jgi:hypothetical protein
MLPVECGASVATRAAAVATSGAPAILSFADFQGASAASQTCFLVRQAYEDERLA